MLFVECKHEEYAQTVNVIYESHGEHHGRLVYKKLGVEVFLYFWNDEDLPAMSGWWMGPAVGGDGVMAFHPDQYVTCPPENGWHLPAFSDEPTSKMKIRYRCAWMFLPTQFCNDKPPTHEPLCVRGMCKLHCRMSGEDCPRHNCWWKQQQDAMSRNKRANRRSGGKRKRNE